MSISFFLEDTSFTLKHKKKKKDWIKNTILSENRSLNSLNFIFCNDTYLLNINKEYLDHNYYTDIITFDLSEEENLLEGDVFISIDRIRENSETHNTKFEDELDRVIIHGVLHLIGYDDKNDSSKMEMRKKEEEYLSLRP